MGKEKLMRSQAKTEQVLKVLERIVDSLIRQLCQSTIPSLALSQAEAQQTLSL